MSLKVLAKLRRPLLLSACLLLVFLVPAVVQANLSSKQARNLISKAGGMSLPSSSVKVEKPQMLNPSLAQAAADLELVFKLTRFSTGVWRITEFRTGSDRWEKLELIASAAGRELPSGDCDNKDLFQPRMVSDLTVKNARCLVAELFAVDLPSDAVRIKSLSGFVVPIASEPSALVVTRVRFDVRFARDRGKWHIQDFRTGSRDWVSVDSLVATVASAKSTQARDEMKLIAGALDKFRQDRGGFLVSDQHPTLIDHLSPKYLAQVIRVDPWQNGYQYEGTRDRFTLRSAGPDGKLNTADDIVLSSP